MIYVYHCRGGETKTHLYFRWFFVFLLLFITDFSHPVRNDITFQCIEFLFIHFLAPKSCAKSAERWFVQRIWDSGKLIHQNSLLSSSNSWCMCLRHRFPSPPDSFNTTQMIGVFIQILLFLVTY